jgi:hypothetical protein
MAAKVRDMGQIEYGGAGMVVYIYKKAGDAVSRERDTERVADFNPVVRIEHIELMRVNEVATMRHPKNPNTHSKDQVAALAKIIEFQGWRLPIKISKRSGFITAGHGRLDAAQLRGWSEVPVSFQDYESDEQEFADLVADNAIAEWSVLDFKSINETVPDLGPDFDIELLGIKNFEIDAADKKTVEFEASTASQFIVSVHCRSESEMQAIYEELSARGIECKLIT